MEMIISQNDKKPKIFPSYAEIFYLRGTAF